MIEKRPYLRAPVGVLVLVALVMMAVPQVGAQSTEVDQARDRVAELEAQQGELARLIEDTWVAQIEAEEELAGTEEALRQAESDLWLARSSVEDLAVLMYMDVTSGRRLSLWLADGPERFAAGVGYLGALGEEEEEVWRRYRSVAADLGLQEERRRSQLAHLDEILSRQESLFSELLVKLEEAQQELSLLQTLEVEREEPTTTTTTTTTTLPPTTTTTRPPTTTTTLPPTTTTRPPTTTPSDGGSVKGVCPVDQPNTFVDTWGAPRSGGRTHRGVDLLAARGTPVRAIYDGDLFRVGRGGLGGNYIWLRTPWDDEFYYAHLDGFASGVRSGVEVEQGDLIGYVGTTGNSPPNIPHLHFEYHPDGGRAVNPYSVAVESCD